MAPLALALTALACQPKSKPSTLLVPGDTVAAPDSFKVAFETNKGTFVVQVFRAWAPKGVDRFHYLAANKFYDGAKFFRVVPNFVVQFGISGDPAVNAVWKDRNIADDSVRQSNKLGYVTYAMGGPNTRTSQIFINLRDNTRLDAMGFAPFARVVEGMTVVQSLFGEYGDNGPEQSRIENEGNAYLRRAFPLLDSVIVTRVTKD